jgi:hypothetical protein
MNTSTFERFGGLSAFIAGLGGLAYSISFVIISQSAPQISDVLTPLFLLLGGLLTTAVLVALSAACAKPRPCLRCGQRCWA